MKYMFAMVIASVSLLLVLGQNDAGEKAKHTIPEVMKKAHAGKGAIMKKVAAGEASSDEKKMLVELYDSLSKNEPPMGDAKDWKQRTTALLNAAKKAADGDEAAAKSLPKLANCMACHKLHKG
jgi:hypothetical protein